MHLRQLLHKIPLLGSLARKLRTRFGGMTATPAAAPLEIAISEPPATIPFADVLRRFEEELGALFAPIKARPRHVSASRSRKWRGHIPKLALSCADAMDRARLLFAGFGFDGGHLRELEREVHYIGLFLMFMRKATKELSALHGNR